MSQYDSLRVSAHHPQSGLSDVIRDLIAHRQPLTIESMRERGFRTLDSAIDSFNESEGYFRSAAPSLFPTRSEVVIDDAVQSVGTQRLQFTAELYREGLVYDLPNAMSVPFLENWMESNTTDAVRVMNPEARTEDAMPAMQAGRLPIYITKNSFSFGIRELGLSRRIGLPLDTRMIKQRTRAINEAIEDAAINGATTLDGQALYVGGYNAPGLLNAPNANTKTLTLAAWVTSPVGTTVMTEINAMFAQLSADYKRGPYTLFVPTQVDWALNLDFKANGNDSIRRRISDMNAGGRPLRIVLVDMLPSTKVVLAQMTDDVMQIVDGFKPTVVPYTSSTGFTFHNIVMAIQVPRFFTDYDGNSGVVVGTLT